MIKNTKRAFFFLLAVVFVFVGMAGFVLPVIPGVVFIALALIIFSIFFPSIRERADRHTTKYPKLHAVIVKLDALVRNTIGEL